MTGVMLFGWDIDWAWLALNIAYVIYVASPVFKEILKLRIVLLLATIFFIIYGVLSGILSVTLWNIPFGLIHLWHIGDLIRQRMSVKLTDEAEALRVLLTPNLDRPDFSKLWNKGREVVVTNTTFISEGHPVDRVSLILNGFVNITNTTGLNVPLGRFAFVGEQSALLNRPASASVTAQGEVRLWTWDKTDLADLLDKSPELEHAWTAALARDLVKKVAPVPSDSRATIPHQLGP